MRFFVTNRHNGRKYPAEGQHWPEHGWSVQIYDLRPDTWGRAPSGVGTGPVIEQGFQKDLERRGWEFPPLAEPVNVRGQELKRLAQGFKKESMIDQLIPAPPVEEHCGHCPEDREKKRLAKLFGRRKDALPHHRI
jgi:hypothetical protein